MARSFYVNFKYLIKSFQLNVITMISLENSIHLFNKKRKMLVIAVIVVVIVILIYTGWYSNLGSSERQLAVNCKPVISCILELLAFLL